MGQDMSEFISNATKFYTDNKELLVDIAIIITILTFFGISIPVFKIPKRIKDLIKKVSSQSTKDTSPDYYKFIRKDAKDLTPEDVLGLRGKGKYGYKEYYYERDFHRELVKRIREGRDAIVVGMSLSGKTRTVYEALKSLGAGYAVTLLDKFDPMEKPDLTVPELPKGRDAKKRVLVIDDINNFIGKPNFDMLLKNFMDDDVTVVATCRTGPDLAGYVGTELSTLFGKPVEIPRLKEDEADQVVKEADVQPPDSFDGNIGSFFIPLAAMKVRYGELSREEKRVLKAINKLHFGGVFIEKGVFPLDRVMTYYKEKNKVKIEEGEFTNLLEDLKEKEFLEFGGNMVQVEEAYLDEVIEGGKPTPEDFAEMIQIFINNPDALFDLGLRAGEIGIYNIRKRDYMRVSIDANLVALKSWSTYKKNYNYASIQNNLGVSYSELANIEERAENLKKAIGAYGEALKVITLEEFPIQYATTQNNLGVSYRNLSTIENTAKNIKRAILAHEEALNVRKLEEFPIQYAQTQHNLGGAYVELSKIEEAEENTKRAIGAYEEALKVRTLEEFPIEYAGTQNNLGVTYNELAKIEDTTENLRRAIKAFDGVLKVITLEDFPINYAGTQNNLGVSYYDLAKIEDTAENLKRAIEAYGEALKVRTIEKFTIDYATTQNNLGNAYKELAKIKDTTDNLKRAIGTYKEALKVYTYEEFPIFYGITKLNLGTTYIILVEKGDMDKNYNMARELFKEALEIFKKMGITQYIKMAENNIEILNKICNEEGKSSGGD